MVRNLLLITSLLLLALGLVLLVNTLRFTSRQLTGVPAAPPVAVPDSAVSRLAEAIRIPTVSYTDYALTDTTQFDRFGQFLRRAFPLLHARLRLERVNQYGYLYEWRGRNPALRPVVLMGHYDVVPVIQGTQRMWKRPPFAGQLDGDSLYGRGTLDDKSCVLALLESAELLLRNGYQPERTLLLAFGQDEEALGQRGAQAIASLLKSRRITPEYVLDEGGIIKTDGVPGLSRPVALIGIGEKGYLSLELTTVAKGGHSSMPPPQTSIGAIANAVATLEQHPFPARLDGGVNALFDHIGPEMAFGQRLVFANRWLFGPVIRRIMGGSNSANATIRTTTAPTIFRAGAKDNVLPIDASATVNFRILPGETRQTVISRVKALIDNDQIQVSVLGSSSDPSPVSDPAAPTFTTVHRTIKSVFPNVVVAPYLVVGGTDARYFSSLCPNVYRFSPLPLDDAGTQTIHGTNERISLTDYRTMIRFYVTLMRNSTH